MFFTIRFTVIRGYHIVFTSSLRRAHCSGGPCTLRQRAIPHAGGGVFGFYLSLSRVIFVFTFY
jgi:hypothetical protein